MTYFKQSLSLLIIFLSFISVALSQSTTRVDVLNRIRETEQTKYNLNIAKAYRLAKRNKWPLVLENKEQHQAAYLTGIDELGFPVYTTTMSGNVSAATISTDKVWQQYSVSGSSANMFDKLAIWDGGTANKTHIELVGRILQKDSASAVTGNSDHVTHTTGTMIATGINPAVKGMAYGTKQLIAYDFFNDINEVIGEAAHLLLSNHSYGTLTGWIFENGGWNFYGNPDSLQDYKFGFYGHEAQMWDSILYNAPNYLIVQSAGNCRMYNGPSVGSQYYYFSALDSTIQLSANRIAGISGNDSFNTIPTNATAKNILTIGAVNGLQNGYNNPSDVVMNNFSSWGPTEDGRIKPDLVADGVGVISTVTGSNNAYASMSGTSMSSPAVTGSLFLLQELYSQKHNGNFMRSASLKAVAIHTTDEAGSYPGPDYQFGWGLMNTRRAADLVANKYNSDTIIESVLNNVDTFRYSFVASGSDPVKATLVWTEAPADINWAYKYNNPASKLINDLDVTVTSNGKTYYPWVLNPKQPLQAATKGINVLDNVERVDMDTTIPGNVYTVTVTHKGKLQRGSQYFSLIVSGVNGNSTCISKPLNTAGLTIDSISINNTLHLKNKSGCTDYTDNRTKVADIEPHQVVPFSIRLGNCGGSSLATDVVKIYVDYNHNGSYSDADELVATSTVIVSNNTFSGSFVTPYSIPVGSKTTMRIVAEETTDTSLVKPCGAYNNGETQDISLQVLAPSNDIAITDIVAPVDSVCNGSALLAIQLYNKGTVAQSNIPVSVIVKNGNTVVSTQSAVCKAVINPLDIVSYTLPASITLSATTAYTISAVAGLANDQDTTNNSFSKTIVTGGGTVTTSTGVGEICGLNAILQTINAISGVNYFWYNSPTSDVPVGAGTSTYSNTVPANNTFYLSSGLNTSGIGLSSKDLFPNGGGYLPLTGNNNYFRYSTNTNIVLQSAKIYTGYPGKITISMGDFSGTTFVPTSSVSVSAPATLATPVKGAYAVNNPADTGSVYSLNLSLSKGTHYIVISTDTNATVFCNNNVTGNPYPMGSSYAVALMSNSASSYQTNYLALYAMRFTTTDCPSARVPVVIKNVNPPVITRSHDTLFSSNLTSNQWMQDGSFLFMATDHYLIVSDSAIYTVSATDSMGCTQTSAGYLFDSALLYIDTTTKPHDSLYAFTIYPNPVIGNLLGIKFSVSGYSDAKISIFNPLGKLCLHKEYPSFTGNFKDTFRVGNLNAGVYYVIIQLKNNTYKRGFCIYR